MQDFEPHAWAEMVALIENDDGATIAARAAELQASGILEWRHPDDENGRTPVMLAYWLDRLSAANELVRAGADYQARDAKGRGVTWYAQNLGKGQTERTMATRISVTSRRLSMESVIRAKQPESDPPPPKPRRRSPGA